MDGCVRAASHYQAGPRLQLAAAFNPGSMHTARGNSHMHMQHRHRHAHRHAQAVSHGGTSLGRPPAATRAALPAELEGVQIPKHVAVILDGNSRWARQRGLPTEAGHIQGTAALKQLIATSWSWGIKALTIYAFSKENWQRPEAEVNFLMNLFETSLDSNIIELHKQDVQVRFIGERAQLPRSLIAKMEQAEQLTSGNKGLLLSIAVSYSGREDITAAARRVASLAAQGLLDPNKVDTACFESHLSTAGVLKEAGHPDLLIRTSGEQRLSNFLLWELAYTELYFTESHWPDFDDKHLLQCLVSYGTRDRRYGIRR